MGRKTQVVIGKPYGYLTPVSISDVRISNRLSFVCECLCGKTCCVRSCDLVSGNTQSCGCYRKETLALRRYKHGETAGDRRYSRTVEYSCWATMINRCTNSLDENYSNYGGRGIKVCDLWREDFSNFFEDMGRKPSKEYSIDRIDNNGNYEPGNCRWATRKEQNRNTRQNRFFEINGVVKCLSEWVECYDIPYSRVQGRLNMDWGIVESLTHPKKKSRYG